MGAECPALTATISGTRVTTARRTVMTTQCPTCGEMVDDDAGDYCPRCGEAIDPDAAP